MRPANRLSSKIEKDNHPLQRFNKLAIALMTSILMTLCVGNALAEGDGEDQDDRLGEKAAQVESEVDEMAGNQEERVDEKADEIEKRVDREADAAASHGPKRPM